MTALEICWLLLGKFVGVLLSNFFRFKIVPILEGDVCKEEIPLIEYWVLSVPCLTAIGKLLPLLPPMPTEAGHLKRIKDGRILVQPSTVPLQDNFITSLSSQLGTELSLSSVLVPEVKPCTRRQFQWAKERWPTAFHPNKDIEKLLAGSFFDEDEHEKIIGFFLEAEKVCFVSFFSG